MDGFGQSSIFFGISLIINLKSFYKYQFHCFSSSFASYFLSSSSFFLFFKFFLKFFIPFLNEKCLSWFDMKKKLKPRKSLGLITGSCWTLLGSTIYLSVDYLQIISPLIYKDGLSRYYNLIRWFIWLIYIDLSA